MGSARNMPDDVLSLLFEMCCARDVVALSGLTRGVVGTLRLRPCLAWKLAARAMLRNLCVPPLVTTSPLALRQGTHSSPPPLPSLPPAPPCARPPPHPPSLPALPLFEVTIHYSSASDAFGALGDLIPDSLQDVRAAMATLCSALAPTFGVPAAEVEGALRYALVQPRRAVPAAAADLHDACCRYNRATPERAQHLALPWDPAAAPGGGGAAAGDMLLYTRVATALRCVTCKLAGGAERQCARCGVLQCASCSVRCSRDCAGGCAFALCADCDAEFSVAGQRPAVHELDEGLGLALPLCQLCGDEPVCPLHQCLVTSECDRCLGMRCNEHVLDHPAHNFCSAMLAGCLGAHCDAPACAPAAGRIKHCQGCYSSFCVSCFPLMQCPGAGGGAACGRCKHCYKDLVCPGCGRREA